MTEWLFIGSIVMIVFTYLGYPLTLLLACGVHSKEVKRADVCPAITFIVTVHNEEDLIGAKLENTLNLDYPKDKLQLLIASDGSTDLTNELVRRQSSRGVELLALSERGGKESAQKAAVRKASGDVLVFSDVATTLETSGLRQLVSSFADPTVGCVSSEDRLLGQDGKPSGEGLYIQYEMWLRALESRVNSLVGLSGSLFAARRMVCEDFSSETPSDFRIVLNSVKMGFRGVSDPLAIGLYRDIVEGKREWARKVRTIVRGLTGFFNHLDLLNVFRFGLFSYQLFCHKLLRWSVPFFLIVSFAANIVLAPQTFIYGGLLLVQTLFYVLSILGFLSPRLRDSAYIRVPFYFLAVNAAILVAWWRYLRGQRIVTWNPTKR